MMIMTSLSSSATRFPLIVAGLFQSALLLLLLSGNDHHGSVFVLGQGCTNVCPPINFGVVVPALCEGDIIDSGFDNNVKADVNRVYDVCYPTSNDLEVENEEQNLSFKFDNLRGPSNTVTVIANYYTGCNAGRRESG
jgi:hypothetical protein